MLSGLHQEKASSRDTSFEDRGVRHRGAHRSSVKVLARPRHTSPMGLLSQPNGPVSQDDALQSRVVADSQDSFVPYAREKGAKCV